MSRIYEPREDSYLLRGHVKERAEGTVLDMGTGSGVQAEACPTEQVAAVDIDPEAVEHATEELPHARVYQSDLFDNVQGRFDTVLFNPPYLPEDQDFTDRTIHGGEEGHETLTRFLTTAPFHLTKDGTVLFLCSSLTGRDKIETVLDQQYTWEILDEQRIGWETLYVYEAQRQ